MDDKKVILIKGDGKWYEQAIFIVKNNDASIPKNLVFEAEKIINEYVNKKYITSPYTEYNEIQNQNSNKPLKKQNKKQSKKNKFLNLYLNLCILGIVVALIYLIHIGLN